MPMPPKPPMPPGGIMPPNPGMPMGGMPWGGPLAICAAAAAAAAACMLNANCCGLLPGCGAGGRPEGVPPKPRACAPPERRGAGGTPMGGEGSEGLGLGGAPLASFTWRREAAGGEGRERDPSKVSSSLGKREKTRSTSRARDRAGSGCGAECVRSGLVRKAAGVIGGGGAAAYPVEHAGVDGAEGELRLVLATAGVGGRDSRGGTPPGGVMLGGCAPERGTR